VALAEGLARNTHLEHLDLTSNEIGRRGSEALGEALRTHPALRVLGLQETAIRSAGTIALLEQITGLDAPLRSLDLRATKTDTEAAYAIGAYLGADPRLQQLDLGHNGFHPVAMGPIADGLARNTHLRHLVLSGNIKLGGDGVRRLVQGALLNATGEAVSGLEVLELAHMKVGADGAKHLAAALVNNTRLRHVVLREYNDIGDEGAEALAEALRHNVHLRSLDLAGPGNNISANGTRALLAAFQASPSLVLLELEANPGYSAVATDLRALREARKAAAAPGTREM